MFVLARSASFLFAAAFLASCSTSGSTPPLSAGPTAGSTTKGPDLFADYVKIHFHNRTSHTLVVSTWWSYPILPRFFKADEKCVDPNADWSSEIGFTYPHGQVEVRALKFDHNFCSGKEGYAGAIFFEHIKLEQDRATIDSDVAFRETRKENYFELCGRQTKPTVEGRKCDKLVYRHHLPPK